MLFCNGKKQRRDESSRPTIFTICKSGDIPLAVYPPVIIAPKVPHGRASTERGGGFAEGKDGGVHSAFCILHSIKHPHLNHSEHFSHIVHGHCIPYYIRSQVRYFSEAFRFGIIGGTVDMIGISDKSHR